MKNIKYLLLVLTFITSFKINAQEVKLSNNKVLVDKVARFNFDKKELGDSFSLYKLDSKEEIIYMALNRNGTQHFQDDDYKRFTFIENNVTIESSRLKFKSWKSIIELLLEEKILNLDGKIDSVNLEKFKSKYNDLRN